MSDNAHHTADSTPYDEASKVTARQGEVFVDGPDGVAVALTPAAAAETSDRLLHAATQAAGQNIETGRQAEERQLRDVR